VITQDQIKLLPQAIGIYLFKRGLVYVYIGKSLNIKERVHNHYERATIDAKEKAIIENSDLVEYIICSSELHALVLESQFIQKYHPPYNVIWKDDKSYLYIKIPIKDPFPRVSLTRRENDGKSLYFGPYSSTKDVRFLLRSIRKIIPFCTQKQPINKPCFYSKIGLCNPCPGNINKGGDNRSVKKLYRTQIRKIIKILNGEAESILIEIKMEIKEFSAIEEYEKSLDLRNKLLYLEQLIHLRSFEQFEYSTPYDPEIALGKLNTIIRTVSGQENALSRIECYDISNLMQQEATASMVVATNGILDKAEYKRFKLKETGVSDFKMLTEAITRRMTHEWTKPDLIIVDGGSPQVVTIKRILNKLGFEIPLIGIAKRPDRIVVYVKGETKTYKFSLHNEGFKLIQQLRDESHRFAKKYHKFLRGKKFINEQK
jgi:excinuclease ABC subunit C